MNISKLFFSVLIIGSTLSFAQLNSGYDGPKPEVYSGSKSFVFMYTPFQSNFNPVNVSTASGGFNNNNSTFSDMNLYGAGFQYYVTKEIALVLGASFGTSTETQDSTSLSQKSETKITSFGVALDANYHLKALYGVSPYVGVNVNFGSYSISDDQPDEGTTSTKTESKGTGIGAGLNFGFDWYFTEGLSLGGKYTIGFRSLSAPEVTSTSGSTSNTAKGPSNTSIGIGTASVMLNVHF